MTEAVDPRAAHRVLLVTLPFGRFGRDLVRAFRAAGAEVRHMVFNTGDLLSRRGPGGIRHQDGAEAWPARLAALAPAFTDIVVFGESGPYNEAVLALDTVGGPRVWVLENGYFRPDWITLERGGANAGSPLPRGRAGYAAEWPEPPPPVPVGPATRSLAVNISLYYFVELYGRWLFPLHKPAFAAPPWRQAVGHPGRYFRGATGSWATAPRCGGGGAIATVEGSGASGGGGGTPASARGSPPPGGCGSPCPGPLSRGCPGGTPWATPGAISGGC